MNSNQAEDRTVEENLAVTSNPVQQNKKTDEPNTSSKQEVSSGSYIGIGMAIGLGLGAIFGIVADSLAIGMAFGVALGAGAGAVCGSFNKRS